MNADFNHPPSLRHVCIALLAALYAADGEAHQGAHVDAWARIDTTLDIRVTLFLDDVLAAQNLHRQESNQLIAAADARQAMDRFEQTLPDLLTVYDANGRRLPAEVKERPRWKPADRGVDLQADGALRLTWQLRFPWQQNNQSFSVRHQFVSHNQSLSSAPAEPTPSNELPTELRLRIKHMLSGRRLEANVAHHQPHTILLPSPLAQQTTRPGTVATAQFVVQPRRLTHEFSIPLALAINTLTTDSPTDHSHPQVGFATTQQLLAEWAMQHGRVTIDGVPCTPLSTTAHLLSANSEQIVDAPTVPLIGTRVGIRTIHPLLNVPQKITVSWDRLPSAIDQVQINALTDALSTSHIVECRERGPSNALTYHWSPTSPPSTTQETRPVAVKFSSHDLWVSQPRGRLTTWSAWIMLGAAAVGITASIAKKRLAIALVLGSLSVAATFLLNTRTSEPDPQVAARLLTRMLDQSYRAVLTRDDETAVNQLSEVLSPEMVEAVFAQVVETVAADPRQAPLVRLNEVRVLTCTTKQFTASQHADFLCEWQVSGQVMHWGHQHQRTMHLTGTIRVDSANNDCRISGISMQSVQPASDLTRT